MVRGPLNEDGLETLLTLVNDGEGET
jgi:hypothetical protein